MNLETIINVKHSHAPRPRRRTPTKPAKGRPRRNPNAPPRRPTGPLVARRPHIIVAGTSATAKRVETELMKTGVPARRLTNPGLVSDAVSQETRALIIVPPIADLSVAKYCDVLRDKHPQLPVFVAMNGTLPTRSVRKLYVSGVQAVFEWPTDKEPLVRTAFRLAGMLGRNMKATAAGGDIALEELVNDHLRTASPSFDGKLAARVQHRFVILAGTVNALWKLHVAEQIAAQVPGVRDVVGNAVRVNGPRHPDRAITNAIRQVLKYATRVDSSTIAIRVKDGCVYLTGTIADRAELDRTIELIRHVRGVRRIDNFATVSAKAKHQDRAIAKRVQTAIATHHAKAKVDTAVFGGVAVLSGIAATAAQRERLHQLAAGQQGVHRVVDKMRVKARRS